MKRIVKNVKRRSLMIVALGTLMVMLSACSTSANVTPISSSSTGFWNEYVIYPLSQFILWLAGIFNGYGWAIIVFTLIIRLILLPLNHISMKSMRKQQELQPELNALKERYSGAELQQEQQKLMAEAGVNPFMGCLPMIIQLPVMYALFETISRTTELRNGTFLWMHLGKPDPYFIMAILAALFTFLSTWISNMSLPEQTTTNKVMMYFMPLMILLPALNFSSAITLYWVVSNAFQVGQTLLLQNPLKIRREQEAKKREERDRQRQLKRAKRRVYGKKR